MIWVSWKYTVYFNLTISSAKGALPDHSGPFVDFTSWKTNMNIHVCIMDIRSLLTLRLSVCLFFFFFHNFILACNLEYIIGKNIYTVDISINSDKPSHNIISSCFSMGGPVLEWWWKGWSENGLAMPSYRFGMHWLI